MNKIYLVRHGLTDWNNNGVFQGRTDIPLNEEGYKQAEICRKEAVDDLKIDAVYSSNLIRAIQTAEVLVNGRGLTINVDSELIERSFGCYEGQPMTSEIFAFISQDYAEGFDGEQLPDALDRFEKAIKKIAENNPEKNILIVSHGNLIANFTRKCNPEILPKLPNGKIGLGNCCVIEYEYDNGDLKVNRIVSKGTIQGFFHK